MSTEYQERVISERAELGTKEIALTVFMEGGVFKSLNPIDQGLMMVQLESMRMYCRTLSKRIDRF